MCFEVLLDLVLWRWGAGRRIQKPVRVGGGEERRMRLIQSQNLRAKNILDSKKSS